MRTPALLLLVLLLAFVSNIPPSSGHGEWGILTEQNFTSQIRLHPHVLLFVTAPWCGESRSLKNEITQLVQSGDEFESLKLMLVYRNSEKVLPQAIGAANGITILYYHHSVPYNYQGKLRASNILSSVHPYLTSPPEELPLKHLKTPKSLKDFLDSSDKALLLFEFCGWTTTLLSDMKKNLEDNRQDYEPSLPGSKPSVILFVDRSSGSLEDRGKSLKALCAFREVAVHHKVFDIINWGNYIQSENFGSQAADEESGSVSLQKTAQNFKTIKLENKVSFVIMDGDKNVALDTTVSGIEGSSLQEILTNLVHRRKEKKLSSIAKDVGFRLLSDDVQIKLLDTLPSQAEVMSGQDTSSSSAEGSSESSFHPQEGDVQKRVGMSSEEKYEKKPSESDSSSEDDKEKVSTNRSEQLLMAERDKTGVYKTEFLHSESKKNLVHSFMGSFFFSDANYALLRGLTDDVKIPSAVIIDPALQQHFVLQDEAAFSYSSLADFLHGYLNGSLSPYTRSESTIQKPREATVPPFVNLDFHEADSIPHITVNTFSHMVHAWNQPSGEKALCPSCHDVLVLFSNNWCGFCQRMELVLREVYRSLKEYKAIIQGGSRNNQRLFKSETPTSGKNLSSPLIFLMDCTLNDCSLILNSINQREVYPSLIFFPAERTKVISYEGETSVTDITEFLARHANNFREFFRILPTLSGKGRRNSNKLNQSSSTDGDKHVVVVVNNRDTEREVNHDQVVNSQSPPTQSVKPAPPKVKIGTILVATEKLATTPPFANSKILIIKADRESGFMGVIFNKRLKWTSFPDLGETAELLKETVLSLGGPVMDLETPLLALSREGDSSTDLELSPGVYFLDHQSVARRIQELRSRGVNPSDYCFFLGYSSWSYEQLFDEIGLGVWDVDNNEFDFAWP